MPQPGTVFDSKGTRPKAFRPGAWGALELNLCTILIGPWSMAFTAFLSCYISRSVRKSLIFNEFKFCSISKQTEN